MIVFQLLFLQDCLFVCVVDHRENCWFYMIFCEFIPVSGLKWLRWFPIVPFFCIYLHMVSKNKSRWEPSVFYWHPGLRRLIPIRVSNQREMPNHSKSWFVHVGCWLLSVQSKEKTHQKMTISGRDGQIKHVSSGVIPMNAAPPFLKGAKGWWPHHLRLLVPIICDSWYLLTTGPQQ